MTATFCVTLKHPRACRSSSSLHGRGPRPLGEKGPGFSGVQRFEGFPRPGRLIPAITAMTGKGICFGSHGISEIYQKEAGGIIAPRGGPGATWVCVGCTSRTHVVSARRREGREGEMKGPGMVAVPSRSLSPCPQAPAPGVAAAGSRDGSVTAGPAPRQRGQSGERGRNLALGSKGQL